MYALSGYGPNPSMRQDDELQQVNKLRQMFISARDARRTKHDNWLRNYRLTNNRIGGVSSSNWIPAPRDSEIYPTISSLVAWQTDQDVVIDATPACDPGSPYYTYVNDISNDLQNLVYSTWIVEDYTGQIKLSLWDSYMYGIGILKSVWDNSLDEGYGNAILRRTDPWSFYPDANATSLVDMEYCFETRKVSYDELERRFPDTCHKLEYSGSMDEIDERPSLADTSGRIPVNPGPLAGAVSRWNNGKSSRNRGMTQDYVILYECWMRENDEWFDDDEIPADDRPPLSDRHISNNWRVVCMAGGAILLDESAKDLWSHGQHPYERYVFDDIGEFYGISLVDHLAYPALYINRLLTAMQQNAELTGNPIFLEPTNSGTERIAVINRPGQRLPIRGQAMQNKPDWLTPPAMPQQVMDLIKFWISRIENTSGISAIVKGSSQGSRQSEGTMSTIQEAAFVRIRASLRNLEKTLEKSTYKIADLMVDNYTEPRIKAILGPNGEKTAKVFKARHFNVPGVDGSAPLKFSLSIQAGSSQPTSRQARVAEADKLAAMGVVDDQYVGEVHQVPHLQEMLKRKYDKMQKGLWSPPGARQRTQRSS